MSEHSEVKKFDLILASLAGVLILSYFLGFFSSSLPSTLNEFLIFVPRNIPINNFVVKKLVLDGRADEIPRFLTTTGFSYLGFFLVSIEVIRMAIKASPQAVPFDIGLKSFYVLSFFCVGIGIFLFAPTILGTSGKLAWLLIYSDFRYVVYFAFFFFLICFEFLIAFQIKKYLNSKYDHL